MCIICLFQRNMTSRQSWHHRLQSSNWIYQLVWAPTSRRCCNQFFSLSWLLQEASYRRHWRLRREKFKVNSNSLVICTMFCCWEIWTSREKLALTSRLSLKDCMLVQTKTLWFQLWKKLRRLGSHLPIALWLKYLGRLLRKALLWFKSHR